VADEAQRHGATVFRGSEQDVLARFHGAAREVDAQTIIRITADCPLLDPGILGRMVRVFDAARSSSQPIDYMSNALDRTFPRGLDGEVFNRVALERAFKEATLPYEREHVTPYIYEHRDLFNVVSFRGSCDYSHYRLTLDTPKDWDLLAAIFSKLQRPGQLISTDEVIELLDGDPVLASLNGEVRQKPLHD
jgi:spore coat polysaccharide biosynthesis protein SpsF